MDHRGWSRAYHKNWKCFKEIDSIYGNRPVSNGRESEVNGTFRIGIYNIGKRWMMTGIQLCNLSAPEFISTELITCFLTDLSLFFWTASVNDFAFIPAHVNQTFLDDLMAPSIAETVAHIRKHGSTRYRKVFKNTSHPYWHNWQQITFANNFCHWLLLRRKKCKHLSGQLKLPLVAYILWLPCKGWM